MNDWIKIEREGGFATDVALSALHDSMPVWLNDTEGGLIPLMDFVDYVDWQGDIELHPRYSHYCKIDLPQKPQI